MILIHCKEKASTEAQDNWAAFVEGWGFFHTGESPESNFFRMEVQPHHRLLRRQAKLWTALVQELERSPFDAFTVPVVTGDERTWLSVDFSAELRRGPGGRTQAIINSHLSEAMLVAQLEDGGIPFLYALTAPEESRTTGDAVWAMLHETTEPKPPGRRHRLPPWSGR